MLDVWLERHPGGKQVFLDTGDATAYGKALVHLEHGLRRDRHPDDNQLNGVKSHFAKLLVHGCELLLPSAHPLLRRTGASRMMKDLSVVHDGQILSRRADMAVWRTDLQRRSRGCAVPHVSVFYDKGRIKLVHLHDFRKHCR